MNAKVHRFEEEGALFDAAAERWATLAREAVARGGAFHVALSGGSSPKRLFERLAERDDIPWEAVHVWFGDERCVAVTHQDSNYRMAREALLERVAIPSDQIHPMVTTPDELSADAARYDALLGERLPTGHNEVPRFDLVMLGLGPDGHIASLFPETDALGERHRWAVANFVAKLDAWRVTLTYPVIEEAAHLLFLALGSEKAGPLVRALNEVGGGEKLPVERVHALGEVEWFVDAAAASRLENVS